MKGQERSALHRILPPVLLVTACLLVISSLLLISLRGTDDWHLAVCLAVLSLVMVVIALAVGHEQRPAEHRRRL